MPIGTYDVPDNQLPSQVDFDYGSDADEPEEPLIRRRVDPSPIPLQFPTPPKTNVSVNGTTNNPPNSPERPADSPPSPLPNAKDAESDSEEVNDTLKYPTDTIPTVAAQQPNAAKTSTPKQKPRETEAERLAKFDLGEQVRASQRETRNSIHRTDQQTANTQRFRRRRHRRVFLDSWTTRTLNRKKPT